MPECRECLDGRARERQHRRVKAPESQVLAIDIAGPFLQGPQGEKYMLVGAYRMEVEATRPEALVRASKKELQELMAEDLQSEDEEDVIEDEEGEEAFDDGGEDGASITGDEKERKSKEKHQQSKTAQKKKVQKSRQKEK